jgi:Zn-dependent protease
LFDFTLQQLILRLCAVVFIVAIHGAAVAGAAGALGDSGPRHDGRLRLSPLAHLDLLGTLSAVLFSIGWIKPIAIDPAQLRHGPLGLVPVVIAGIAATLLAAIALVLVRPIVLPLLPDTASQIAFLLIEAIGQLSLWFALVNLLPVPTLTGGHLLTAIFPQWRESFRRLQPYAAALLTVLAALGLITSWLERAYQLLAGLILRQ